MTMTPKDKIVLISKIVFLGFAAAALYWGFNRFLLGEQYPYGSFLFDSADQFMDFYNPRAALMHGFAPYADPLYLMPHFPFAMLLEYLPAFVPADLAFSLSICGFCFFFFFSAFIYLNDAVDSSALYKALPVMLLLSYPFLFLVDRGNFEAVVYVLIALFVYWHYVKPRPWLACFSISAAIAMKLFPAIFLLSYLKEKDYKSVGRTICLAALLTLGALALAKGGVFENLTLMKAAQAKYFNLYALGAGADGGTGCGLAFGHSLFGVLRLAALRLAPHNYMPAMNVILPAYNIFVALYAVCISAYVVFIEKTVWKITALLVFTFNLLPYVSTDYKLIHLFIPLLLFIKAPSGKNSGFYCVLFALLLIPKAYFKFAGILGDSFKSDVSVSVLITPAVLLLGTAAIIREGFKARTAPAAASGGIS